MAAADPLVGRNIGGRYLVGERIGTGGMGTVYRGRHQLVGRDVALKFLAPRYARDPRARERFLREARAANRIDHEHIIDITDFGETSDNLVFLVMEYLEGEPLGALLAGKPLSAVRALGIARQVASALARAHELDVIHRDIKPDNIFVQQRTGGDYIKLLDFGLARVIGERRLTATGKVFGTPEYIAPELARGDQPTGAADQYGLGCVLYEMLTGTVPFHGPPQEVLLKHLQEPPDPPTVRNRDLPTSVDRLVLRMLGKDPAQRFGDCFHLNEELTALLERMSAGRRPRSVRPASGPLEKVTTATQPWVDAAEETWAVRVEALRRAIEQAHSRGDVPPDVGGRLDELEALVERARAARASLGDKVLLAQQREDEMRAARLRLGRAVDELGRDESRAARNVQQYGQKLEEAEAQLDEIGTPVAETWQRLLDHIHESPALDRAAAELLRQAGGQAALWLDSEANCAALRVKLDQARREHEDVRFQISQLKGRLGILTAEGESDLLEHRREADALGATLSSLLEKIAAVAGPLLKRFDLGNTELRSHVEAPADGVGRGEGTA